MLCKKQGRAWSSELSLLRKLLPVWALFYSIAYKASGRFHRLSSQRVDLHSHQAIRIVSGCHPRDKKPAWAGDALLCHPYFLQGPTARSVLQSLYQTCLQNDKEYIFYSPSLP